MKPCVVTSSDAAALLLGRLLGPELERRVELLDGRSWLNAVGRARAMVREGANVALVLGPRKRRGPDAHEWDKAYAYSLLNPSAERTGPAMRVILLRSAPEGLLFLEPDILRRIAGHEPRPEHLQWARGAPREALSALLGVKPATLAKALRPRLEEVDLMPLASRAPIRRLRKFIHAQIQRSERRTSEAISASEPR
ncbi:hypothetical protein HPC49_35955 [Pyxidicoccus fallax]|uniref:Uncharacterized protein n=1 Tax=Pyxidicoccus fallax TaxID=394095 RepID=A0A848LAU0_9BACT|nr:hypothetical protein [Pyxidicoccus fallax]NMO15362.1 hypothetical protein [Pyxidicoccus fallax]NPC83606.1 hypothetical protein [Pyxidicoccus fallax]